MPLTRRNLLYLSTASMLAAMATPRLLIGAPATSMYENSIIIDGLGFPGGLSTDESAPVSGPEVDHIRQSGLTATHLTVGAVGSMPPLLAFEKIVRDITRWQVSIQKNPEALSRVLSANDIRTAKFTAQTGLIYGLQDGVSFEDDLDRLEALHQLGIRIIQPTYNRRNLLGDGCMERANAGLSRTGVEAIKRMNELGILVDLSHCGKQTTAEAIRVSKRPVSFTHTGCHALAEHPRHKTDEELVAVANSGGIIGIFVMPYLSGGQQPTARDVILHLEHAINVAGEDHVSIGTDGSISPTTITEEYADNFRKTTAERKRLGIAAPLETETGYLFANDLNTPRRFETLAGLLLDRGHSVTRIEKILGANLMRVFSESWGQ